MQNRRHDAITEVVAQRYLSVPWRVGNRVPRNLYANVNPDSDDGVAFGQLDSSWLAEHVVALHNAALEEDT